MQNFFIPISELSGVGQATAAKLKKINLETISDLILYYPKEWKDLTNISNICDLQDGEEVTIKATIELIESKRAWKKRMNFCEALVHDDTGSIKILWFNQTYITKTLSPQDEIYLSGKVNTNKYGQHMTNPVYEKTNKKETTHTARIVPSYPLTKGVTHKQLRFLISNALEKADKIPEWMPEKIIKKYNLCDLAWAYKNLHFPDNFSDLEVAKNRLKFDELFLIQLYSQKSREELKKQKATKIKFHEGKIKQFVESLPFKLTDDQKKASFKILKDLEKEKPMNRLLEGDVGSGKTIVAAIAMLNVALNGQQSVFMAPTEILAEQHYKTLSELLPDEKISLITKSKKKKLLNSNIFIGTHALIQKTVEFEDLALAIIDEQHRFGVDQRKTLKDKSGDNKTIPHLLSMTATPIPRSLALTIYGDLDLSIILEKPKNRKPIISKLVNENKRENAYQFINNQIKKGQQVFVICPLIEESDKLGVKSVTEEYKKLSKDIFPDLRIEMLHGKLKSDEKEQIMNDFHDKKNDILVSTSVIEVGIDIPNATVMMIEGADRFGLAQLHQFRGRVGRSDIQSYCFVFTDNKTQKTKERLNLFVQSDNGFELAEYDLQLRGPGDVYGTQQSGFLDALKLATLADHHLISQTKEAVTSVLP
ncbi:MAG: ATP-dependent DNA helicase RecG, partial [Patescibacteria group bacterium]